MFTQAVRSVNACQINTEHPGARMEGESAKAFAAFITFRDLGPDRTLRKVAEKLSKSEQLMARWGKKYNWHHRAADWDEHNDKEMQRGLFTRRARARKRALDMADRLNDKLFEAVELLKVSRVVKIEGKPDEVESAITPSELANLFRVVTDVQHRILGKEENEEVYEFHVHFDGEDPDFAHEQPEVVLAARRKAQQENQPQDPNVEQEAT